MSHAENKSTQQDGAAPALCSGGLVGMRATPAAVMDLAERWDALAASNAEWAETAYAARQFRAAAAHRGARDALRNCARELRRLTGLTDECQPHPNSEVTP